MLTQFSFPHCVFFFFFEWDLFKNTKKQMRDYKTNRRKNRSNFNSNAVVGIQNRLACFVFVLFVSFVQVCLLLELFVFIISCPYERVCWGRQGFQSGGSRSWRRNRSLTWGRTSSFCPKITEGRGDNAWMEGEKRERETCLSNKENKGWVYSILR